ncbi:uncharacterized protein LOC132050807 [Lycium ferocissimum]|uniref:uncharacterized protein LOC132050807 n=1 Tax=Lycium ferocissimum TaxID=112874 RepID=UPI002815D2A8|nr:uncharacterized protein LOC132050807 [Lycium ferocissimum]
MKRLLLDLRESLNAVRKKDRGKETTRIERSSEIYTPLDNSMAWATSVPMGNTSGISSPLRFQGGTSGIPTSWTTSVSIGNPPPLPSPDLTIISFCLDLFYLEQCLIYKFLIVTHWLKSCLF